ncbi:MULTISPECIES: formyltransferase family protein [Halanaerobium]|jgi:methionyl-tRNA formyltransferase|uniref:Methionyl-tRNA formyltransferase n=1 Tax=Halanaerobium congolense TaxID=54121 RepID=A0A1G6QJM2_9FIRM|nr:MULTISPECIES: formyltransferase family protein [Halanaerobium]RCW48197.1 methionyl-tRNA formyltransferase [Halanaerobium sp. MA284_MarDTE_T2]SDC92508.1 methionyl-tRNA formyltransferase [Halanaerobium congolense]
MKFVIATIKSWNIKKAEEMIKESKHQIKLITDKNELNYEKLNSFNPEYIFFPHWSWIIPDNIYNNFNCVVFHMTDLPYGRGGSPLQNLIVRGIENTKISALKVDGGLDTGPIYLKKDLNLNGTAEEIFLRSSSLIFNEMIPEIINNEIIPKEQKGEVVEFKRRKPYQSEIKNDFSLSKVYDHIRMLDAEGYPDAFIEYGDIKLEFSRAKLTADGIVADVKIKRLNEDDLDG